MSYCANCPIGSHWPDRLRSGIWPQSLSLWLTAFWIVLFIIRPWEMLFPQLGEYRLERVYALTVIAIVVCQGQLRLCNSFQTTAVLAFLSALLLSWLAAFEPPVAWVEMYKYITLVVFYFVLLSVIRTPYQLVFITVFYLISMAAYLAKSQWEFFVNGAGDYAMGVWRLIGIEITEGGPNAVAASTVLSLPLLHFLWQHRKWFTRPWPKFLRVCFPYGLAAYFVLAVSSIVLTNSRSGMLGFVVFVVLAMFGRWKRGGKLAAVGASIILLAVIWFAMPEENKNRLRSVWDPSAGPSSARASAVGRIEGMLVGLEMFRREPITGAGIGNFIPYRLEYIDDSPFEAHSLIGQILGETGLLGTGTFFLVVAALLVNCRRTTALARQNPDASLQVLAGLSVACTRAILLLLFFGVFSHNLYRFNWLWLAAFALLCRMFAETVCSVTSDSRAAEPARLEFACEE